jgi:flagellar motor switch protein FliM
VELDGGGGEVHLTLPYSMVEPIRELLDAGVQSDRAERDERWIQNLHEEILDAEVEITSMLAEARLTIGDFLHLRKGDVIPISLPETATVFAEDVPIFRGRMANSNGNKAIQFESLLRRTAPRPTPVPTQPMIEPA